MNMKKVLSVFLVLVLMLGTIPGMSFAVHAEGEPEGEPAAETVTISNQQTSGTMSVTLTIPEREPISYIDADGTVKQTGPDCYDVYTTDTSLGIKSTEQWYVVCEDMTLTAEESLKILGDFRLILCDGATLTAPHGINLDNGSITIYGQSNDPLTMGKLVANAHDDNCAAIGSSASKAPGAITINGGNITATGSENGAAIGGGKSSKNVGVTINGGVVNATGGANSAAIGGGAGATNVNVTVNGGVVNATGGENGAAINGNITVRDGAVTANGGGSVAALSGTLTVNGGEVTATGGENGAAINGNITVSDGTVNANGGATSAAINGDLTVTGGVVTATGDANGAAISGNLTVDGGAVTADGANGAAIGGNLTFNGGTVTATGVPALSGSATLVHYMPIKAGDSADTAVDTDAENLTGKKYIHIDYIPEYTITWKDYNGNVLDTTKVLEGVIPTTNVTPYRSYDSECPYGYKFTGWTPKVVAATADATYTATYSAIPKMSFTAGKYIRLGYYNGKPVDWYCQRINGTGTMMLCKYALKSSSFGSNATYKESNVHAWLDVDSGGTFAKELRLTDTELNLVRTVNLSSTGGDGTDSFIIPAYGNDELNSGQKVHAPYKFGTNTLVDQYWLRTARDSSNERIVNHSKDGMPIATVSARYSGVGNSRWIRPMFYLNTSALEGLRYTGTGTEDDPYVVEPKYEIKTAFSGKGGGTVSASTRSSQYSGALPVGGILPNDRVQLYFTPNPGTVRKGYSIKTDNGANVTVIDGSITYFYMPASDITVTVNVELQKHNVTWKNYDGTVLKTDTVEYGTVPTYDGDEPTKDNCTFTGWTDGTKTYAPDALPEVTGNVTYTAVFTFNNGVGERVAGYTLSLEGDIAVNYYMELEPSIAQSETAYMHFTIPNGSKTTELDVPVSQATVKGGYYVFKCNVAAKDMNATITGQIIDGEKVGDPYTYSVREYSDYLFANADENGTDAQKAYAAAAPLVEKMLTYGAYAQKYFAPDTAAEELANVDHEVDISGVTADMIAKSAYWDNVSDIADFSGATLSLKSQTTLSLYFTSDEELTFNCAHEFETEKQGDYQIIRIRNIHVKNLTSDFTVTVSAGNSRRTVTFSPMNYCYNVLNSEQPETLQNVCKALYLYAVAANDYFNEPIAPAHVHTAGEAVRENEVPATCTATGSYDEVVYCTECGEKLSTERKTIDIIPHTPGDSVNENVIPASCAAEGSYDEVVYCTECGEILSTEHKTIDIIPHTPGSSVNENVIPASCIAEGSHDEVVYCTECHEELSRETIVDAMTAHRPTYVAMVAPTQEATGMQAHYECPVCHKLFADAQGNTEIAADDIIIPKTAANTIILDYVTADTVVQNGYTVTGELKGNYKISIAAGATVTIKDATITCLEDSGDVCFAGITPLGDATINLDGTNTVRGGYCNYPGIFVPKNKTLTIKGTGSLDASSNGFACGIGGGYEIGAAGNIVINGGTITATGSDCSAGIGGGNEADCGSITINGGTVTATGGDGSAGIGSGELGSCGGITISGGTVTANGGEYGAGIGSSSCGECGNIKITGGTVNATGGEEGAGIGSGDSGGCGNINITGGTVTANGGYEGAGIGTGCCGRCGNITIAKTVTKVTATKGEDAASIGEGVDAVECGTISIASGANVIKK